MILTQRQLEQLLRTHGRVVVPYRARLTPMAADWVKHNRVTIGYADTPAGAVGIDLSPRTPDGRPPFFYWSDGPNGVGKAALMSAANETRLEPMPVGEDTNALPAAIKRLNWQVKDGKAGGGVLLTHNAGLATILANKAAHLRAIVACNLTLVEEAVRTMAANVLVLQHDAMPLNPMRNLITRFCRAERPAADAVARRVAEVNG